MKKHVKVILAVTAFIGAAAAVSKALCDFAMGTGKGAFTVKGGFRAGKGGLSEEDSSAVRRLDERREKYRKWFLDNSEDIYLLTNSNVKVHALFAKAEGLSHRYAIVCHGYKDDGSDMGWQAYNFVKMGYNVLAPDGRASGKTAGNHIGMGYHESKDLRGYINFILARDSHAEIVLYGVSMGAAEVMLAAGEKLPDNVKAVIEDCGYTSVWDEFKYNFKQIFKIPAFPLLYMASAYSKVFLGFGFKDADAEKALRHCKLPILMIHGSEDDFVPFFMLDRLFSAAAGEKEKLVIPGAKHIQSDLLSPELYWGTVGKFLKKYVN